MMKIKSKNFFFEFYEIRGKKTFLSPQNVPVSQIPGH